MVTRQFLTEMQRRTMVRSHLWNKSQHATMVTVTKTEASSLSQEPRTTAVVGSPSESLSTAPVTIKPPVGAEKSDGQRSEVTVTHFAFQRVRNLVAKRGDGMALDDVYLRVYVDAGGCSGFQYKFELTQDTDEAVDDAEDTVFEQDGARVVVDEASLDLIQGSTIDFVQEMIKSSFVVSDNPQSESACGCGSSFAVKNFASNPAID